MKNKHKILVIAFSSLLLVFVFVFIGNKSKNIVLQNKEANSATNFINQSAKESLNTAKEAPTTKPLSIQNIESICEGAERSSFGCYEKYYEALVKNEGIKSAFADIKEREIKNSYVKTQCHPLAHSIGHAATSLFKDVRDAYAEGDSYCWSGYYHGILEQILETKGKEVTLAELNTICEMIPGKDAYSFDYYNCVHGLGHGLMATAGQNLFKALDMCDDLTGGWEKSSCYGGVFMENVIIENKGGITEYLKPEDPVYPCNAVGNNYKQVCYLMQTSYMLKVSQNNFSKVFDLCSTVESPYSSTCYQGLGRDASGQSLSDKVQTKITCELGKTYDQRANCIVGAVRDFVSFYHSDAQAKELCYSLDKSLDKMCLDTVTSYYKSF